jgi:glycosyltransferase involved in cell wall biosynthesis
MPHKILIVNWRDIRNPEAGGAEVHYHEIFRRLNPSRWEVSVLASSVPGFPREETIDTLRVFRRGRRSTFNFWVYANINRFVRKGRYELVVDDVNKLPFFLPKILKRVPVVGCFHHLFGTSIFRELGPLMGAYVFGSEKLIGWGYRGAPFTAVSQSTFDELTGFGLDPTRGRIIHNGIDLKHYVPDGPSRDARHILFVGRIKRYKNVGFLLRLHRELLKSHPEARLTIAGGGDYLPELRRQAEGL